MDWYISWFFKILIYKKYIVFIIYTRWFISYYNSNICGSLFVSYGFRTAVILCLQLCTRGVCSHLCEFLYNSTKLTYNKFLDTLAACKEILFFVDPFMYLQFTTFGPGELLFSNVSLVMSFKIVPLFECLATFGAGKWLLSCVGPFMSRRMVPLVECLATFGAGK